MGKDPRRLDGLGGDERFAAVALERVTGGVATAHDVAPRQGAHDLDLLLPRGRRAAVEVTTIAGPGVRHRVPLLGGDGPAAPAALDGHGPTLARLLPAATTDLLLVPHVARRAAKVAAVRGADERHLFVGIGTGWLPARLYRALAAADGTLPSEDPVVQPAALTHLWLVAAAPGAPLVGWQRGTGWSRHEHAG